jgi:hypothetical protein
MNMNPLLNEQLGQSTHREYEAKYGRPFSSEEGNKIQSTFPGWQKLVIATGSIASLIVLGSLLLTG